jgi:hypothetical protein
MRDDDREAIGSLAMRSGVLFAAMLAASSVAAEEAPLSSANCSDKAGRSPVMRAAMTIGPRSSCFANLASTRWCNAARCTT